MGHLASMGRILVGCETTENEQIHEMSSIRIINGVGRNQWILITMVKSSLLVVFSSNIILAFFGTSTNVRHSKNYKVNKLFSVVGTANLLTLVDR